MTDRVASLTPIARAAHALANGERIGSLPEARHYRLAREVLIAIRDPSRAMKDGAAHASLTTSWGDDCTFDYLSDEDAGEVFRSMIDVALSEG